MLRSENDSAEAQSRGHFFSFEGTEGSGKTTQIRELSLRLEADGFEVIQVREPGGTPLSEKIRTLLLEPAETPVDPWAELCLYLASRAQLVAERIRPALSRGAIVLADRFGDASVAHEGTGRELGVDKLQQLNAWVTGGLRPERIFLFDLDPTIGLARAKASRGGQLDRMESEPMAFHKRVREAYLSQALLEPERYVVVDASLPRDEVGALIRTEIERRLS
jgi:dTMP kinase